MNNTHLEKHNETTKKYLDYNNKKINIFDIAKGEISYLISHIQDHEHENKVRELIPVINELEQLQWWGLWKTICSLFSDTTFPILSLLNAIEKYTDSILYMESSHGSMESERVKKVFTNLHIILIKILDTYIPNKNNPMIVMTISEIINKIENISGLTNSDTQSAKYPREKIITPPNDPFTA
jgi:hypothetical protein